MMNIKYMLTASGSITMPMINHVLRINEITHAQSEAIDAVKTLSKAGFYQFHLWDMTEIDHLGQYKLIEEYRVELPEPMVTVK